MGQRLALGQAQNALDEKTRAIVSLRREHASNVETITDLSAKAERLQRAEDRRITALQERQHALQEQEELRQHLVAAELARLESEKRLYELITEVIQLEPSQTQDFFELQERLREEAKQRQPTPLLKDLAADLDRPKERR